MAPMRVTPSTKAVFGLVLLIAALAYLVIVEVAVSAGRIHHGVDVNGFDIGGLNQQDAVEALRERGDEMKESPMIFTSEGFDCRLTPEQIGWGPQPADTAAAAMAVGRDDIPFGALADRWRAWTSGASVDWQGRTHPAKVGRELNRCEQASEGLGVEIDRPRLRFLIKKTVLEWPRGPVEIPLSEG